MLSVLKKLKRKIANKIHSKKTNDPWLPPQYANIEMGNLLFGNSRGSYPVERGDLETMFAKFLENNGFTSYGHLKDKPVNDDYISYENATFLIRPYYWGDDPKIAEKPNFVYKPTGLEISWYKYPFRDAYSSERLNYHELNVILEECERSIKNA